MACPTIRGRSCCDGIHPYGAAIRMAAAGDAAGVRSSPGSRRVDRAGIREGMRYAARNVDHAVHVPRGIVKTRIARVDVSVAVFTNRARREAGMNGVSRRKAVARAAARGFQVVRVAPYRRFVCAAGECCAVTVGIGALEGRFVIDGTYTAGLSERAKHELPPSVYSSCGSWRE